MSKIDKVTQDGEIEKFDSQASNWWINNEKRVLYTMNTIRVPFVVNGLVKTNKIETHLPNSSDTLKNIFILDVGCGGGYLSDALARLGGTVHGVDSAVNLIKVAKDHAQQESLTNLTYFATSIEDFAEQNSEKYDVVVASEIIEHVTEKELFLKACIKCLKPGGSFYITTFNRTTISWILGIWVIQEIFNIIPRGTHEWDLFISPEHLEELLIKNNCKVLETKGKFFNLVTRGWYWLESTSLMYAMHAVKL